MILVKYDASGAARIARTVSKAGNESLLHSVSVDYSGDIYAAGEIYSYLDFVIDGLTITASYVGANPILVKFR